MYVAIFLEDEVLLTDEIERLFPYIEKKYKKIELFRTEGEALRQIRLFYDERFLFLTGLDVNFIEPNRVYELKNYGQNHANKV